MHNGKFVPTADQENLIRSLESKFHRETVPQVNLSTHGINERNHSSLGTISDNLRFVSRYICECGTKPETVGHSTLNNGDGSAIDTYQLNCGSCGMEEKVNFHMMRQALQKEEHNQKPQLNKRSRLYPYL